MPSLFVTGGLPHQRKYPRDVKGVSLLEERSDEESWVGGVNHPRAWLIPASRCFSPRVYKGLDDLASPIEASSMTGLFILPSRVLAAQSCRLDAGQNPCRQRRNGR
jgi:hypothetical protein